MRNLLSLPRLISSLVLVIIIVALTLLLPSSTKAASCGSSNIRWASSSNTIYLTGPVSCTLTQIKTIRPTVPLDLVDSNSHIWLLKANLKLEGGAMLILHGASIGGDVNWLRLRSNNSSTSNSTIWIRAQWGSIDIAKTKITSWDEAAGSPDSEIATFKRSYIHVRSFLESDGITARESRMDIINSEVGYLGFNAAESYGLTWKVLGSSPGIYDKVNVYGNIINSHIHHNYFGTYTFGADSMQITNNEIDNNIQYGLDPHDDSDNLVIEENNSHHNGNHGIICSQRCNNLIIRNNLSNNNKGNGIMLHRNANDSLVEGNQLNNNTDSGIAIFDSHNNTIRNNTSLQNKNGIRLSVGSSSNTVENNEFGSNSNYGIYFYKGSDLPTSGDGRPKQNKFIGNNTHDNLSHMVRMSDSDSNTFQNNQFTKNGLEIYFTNSKNNLFIGNTLIENTNNFIRASSSSNATIQNTDQASVKITDSISFLEIEDIRNFIFENDKNIASIATPIKNSIRFTKAISSSVVNFKKLNFKVIPKLDQVIVSPKVWEASGAFYKKWTESSNNFSNTAIHLIGDLKTNTNYDVLKNGVAWNSFTSDASGNITFEYNGGYFGTLTFEVKEKSPEVTATSPDQGNPEEGEKEATQSSSENLELSPTPSVSPNPSVSPSPSITPTPSPSSSNSPTPTASPSSSPSPSPIPELSSPPAPQ